MPEIKEFISDFHKNFSERVRGPFYIAFAISRVAFNWKPISIFLFSKEEITIVINQVSYYASIKNQLCYPLGSMLFFVFCVPLLNAIYAYYQSFVSFIRDSGDALKPYLLERKALKIKEANAETERKTSELMREVSENQRETQKLQQESEDLKKELGTLRQYHLATQNLENEIKQLKSKNSELMVALGMWFSGQKPNGDYLPSDMPSSERRMYLMGRPTSLTRHTDSENQNE